MRRSAFLPVLLAASCFAGALSPMLAQVPAERGGLTTDDRQLTTRLATSDSRLVTVFLVRHAEKADDSRDPILSEAGKIRAAELSRMLSDARITHIWSTDYQRTRLTAEPLARKLGLQVMSYNPSKLDEFAQQLKETPGRHLVVGHSNTTGELVQALGGQPGAAIQDIEYDRFYAVVLGVDGPVTVLLRFGSAGQ